MAKNVVGLFDTPADAQAAVQDLRSAGFRQDQVSFVGNNARGQYDQHGSDAGGSAAAEGAGAGATTGTVVGGIGGLLAGLGLFAIPGIGPVLGAGTLITALGMTAAGAGIGAAAGGLLGALVGAGIPEEDANLYSEGVRRGGTLLMVHADDNQVDNAVDILNRHNVVDIDDRGTQYRSGGWTRFDENASTHSGSSASSTGGEYRDSGTGGGAYAESSKLGTATGGVAGAATGAAIGSVGGPIGTVIGGVAGALAGGGVGAAGDAVGAEATDSGSGAGSGMSSSSMGTSGSTVVNTNYAGSTGGDADTGIGGDDYARSSKIGTAGGGLTGAATGAAIGSVGGPVGTVIGGVAGALAGGGVGAAGDAAGAEATDDDGGTSRSTRGDASMAAGTAYGSATDVGGSGTTVNTNYTSGTTGMNTGTTRTSGMNTGTTGTTRTGTVNTGDEIAVPIVEEQLNVGKREVDRGGVRVYTRVQEVPVEEQVTLRDEHIDVQRRPVNRPVSDADLANIREGTLEVRETDEEAVVAKEARVVEEVVIRKEAEERTETVRDTVRRTDVDVEQIPGQTSTTGYTTTGTTGGSTMGTTGTTGSTSTSGSTGTSGSGRSLTDRIEGATGRDVDRDGDVGGRTRS